MTETAYEREHASGFPERETLVARLAEVGLVAERLDPFRCHGRVEYVIVLRDPFGALWAEGSHESADSVHRAVVTFVRGQADSAAVLSGLGYVWCQPCEEWHRPPGCPSRRG